MKNKFVIYGVLAAAVAAYGAYVLFDISSKNTARNAAPQTQVIAPPEVLSLSQQVSVPADHLSIIKEQDAISAAKNDELIQATTKARVNQVKALSANAERDIAVANAEAASAGKPKQGDNAVTVPNVMPSQIVHQPSFPVQHQIGPRDKVEVAKIENEKVRKSASNRQLKLLSLTEVEALIFSFGETYSQQIGQSINGLTLIKIVVEERKAIFRTDKSGASKTVTISSSPDMPKSIISPIKKDDQNKTAHGK